MNRNDFQKMLTLPQAIGLLQRFMPQRNAAEWLENDRRFSPVLPFLLIDNVIYYFEADLARLVLKLTEEASLRHAKRRYDSNRRIYATDRRHDYDRRYLRRKAAANNLDRRFAVRPDRRCDLDRRIRGWVDRRCINDRRLSLQENASTHTPLSS